ncbi:MAG: HD domain-containing protein, partial [Acidaminococcaceae bacterium]|nr:HD domain-containing protein [Acidaminococcaceae bacterium]
MQTPFPSYVLKTLKLLNTAGYEAYVVGGAVRDILLGREPGDYDITTSGRPEQVAAVLGSSGYKLTENLGENFGVVAAVTESHALEIATFRNERYVYGSDAHRPAEVWYCDTLEEDLSRRDFTVNAMAMDADGKLYDYFGGQQDLRAKLLRTVGDPRKRFAEDALRMYRACRFVAQLDFTYVEGTDTAADVAGEYDDSQPVETNLRNAMKKAGKTVPQNLKSLGPDAQLTAFPGECGFGQPGTKYRLKKRYEFDVSRCRNLSLERVKTELDKMLLGKAAGKGLALFLSSGLANAQCRVRDKGGEMFVDVLPELAHLPALPQNIRFHCYNVWEHILAAVDNGPVDITLRWALLLHDVAKGLPGIRGATPDGYPNDHGHEKESAKMAETILTRLRYPRPFVRRISWLVAKHMRFAPMMIHKNNTLLRWIRS